jgi:NADPH-dependent 2,4-dienoyl-CoA reductase/sulfur reductase-like enzyme
VAGSGADLEGVHVLRTVDDSLALRAAFDRRSRVAIVGAGFIGCEVAQTARKEDLDVTLIDIADTPMLPLGPELGQWCADLHRGHGVDLRLGTAVAGLLGDGRVEAVELAGGERIDADVVVVGLGAVPNTEWLADSGLRADPGLECDATLTVAADPDILAAGDIVSWPHPLADGEALRISVAGRVRGRARRTPGRHRRDQRSQASRLVSRGADGSARVRRAARDRRGGPGRARRAGGDTMIAICRDFGAPSGATTRTKPMPHLQGLLVDLGHRNRPWPSQAGQQRVAARYGADHMGREVLS